MKRASKSIKAMGPALPATMRSILMNKYLKPSDFELSDTPIPVVAAPDHVLIRVHAASINPSDMEAAAGHFKAIITPIFPVRLGFDLSGTVVEIGSSVDTFAVGDEVFCCLPPENMGSWSEYALTTSSFLAHKPKSLSHVEAAALPMIGMTTVQAFERVSNGFIGGTILIPAGLGGVGSVACQVAKSVYGAKKVITTVSTENVLKVDELLGKGAVDEVIDYKSSDPLKVIAHGSVDFLYDTVGVSPGYFPLLRKSKSSIISIHGTATGTSVKLAVPSTPFLIKVLLDIVASFRSLHAWFYGIYFDGILMRTNGPDLQKVAAWVNEGKLKKPLVGRTVRLEDIEAVREACIQMSSASRSIGKVVIEVI